MNLAARVYTHAFHFLLRVAFLHVGCCCLSTCVRAQRANKSPEKNSRTTTTTTTIRRKKASLHIGCLYFSLCSARQQTCLTKKNSERERENDARTLQAQQLAPQSCAKDEFRAATRLIHVQRTCVRRRLSLVRWSVPFCALSNLFLPTSLLSANQRATSRRSGMPRAHACCPRLSLMCVYVCMCRR